MNATQRKPELLPSEAVELFREAQRARERAAFMLNGQPLDAVKDTSTFRRALAEQGTAATCRATLRAFYPDALALLEAMHRAGASFE